VVACEVLDITEAREVIGSHDEGVIGVESFDQACVELYTSFKK